MYQLYIYIKKGMWGRLYHTHPYQIIDTSEYSLASFFPPVDYYSHSNYFLHPISFLQAVHCQHPFVLTLHLLKKRMHIHYDTIQMCLYQNIVVLHIDVLFPLNFWSGIYHRSAYQGVCVYIRSIYYSS